MFDVAGFWLRVEGGEDDECWVWTGAPDSTGYGRVKCNDKHDLVHRVAYMLEVGPIPPGRQLDHLCRNLLCVNPRHLEPVSSRENTLRGFGVTAANARKTHCKRGHEFTPENTIARPLGRNCRACRRIRAAERRLERDLMCSSVRCNHDHHLIADHQE